MRARDLIICSGLCLLGACHLAVPFDPQQTEFVSSSDASTSSRDGNSSSADAGNTPDVADAVLQDQARAADSGLADAAQTPVACAPWPAKPTGPTDPVWSTPEPLARLNTKDKEQGVFLSRDQLTIYFASDRGGNLDIYRAQRDDKRSSAFSKPEPLDASVNTAGDEFRLVIAPDSAKAYLSRSPSDSADNADILWADIGQHGTFGDFSPIQAISTTGNEHDPFIDSSGSLLYFGREPSPDQASIWVSHSDPTTPVWTSPSELPLTGNPPAAIGNPVVSQDGLLLLFNGAAPGPGVGVDVDLWYALRPDGAASFEVVGPIPDLDSTGYEGHIHLSPDACTIYFTSNREGDRDLYWSSRLSPK